MDKAGNPAVAAEATPVGARGGAVASANRLSPLSTPSATREVLERHGLYTKYALGQNFLVNDDVVRKIADLAEVEAGDHVLEVGPGIGTLTSALLQIAGHVTSVEMDHDLPHVLQDTLAPWLGRFTLIEMDALDLRLEHLEQVASAGEPSALPNKLVSNLPYAVAATIVLDYLQRFDFLESATVMVQKEVADRIMAKPGNKSYGAYTVKLSLYSQPAGRFPVAPGNFFPPPHVDSAVIRLDRVVAHDDGGVPLGSELLSATCTMADAAFATRRKTIANSCKTYFSTQPDIQAQLPALFERAGIDSRRRGETLDRAEFIRLGQALIDL
jgi:16S rRNA (adenine1518-N6/adenine1519-N6)-dimethyltransferase